MLQYAPQTEWSTNVIACILKQNGVQMYSMHTQVNDKVDVHI
jgi:hypothetical protein